MYAYYKNLYLYYARENIFYHFPALFIIIEKVYALFGSFCDIFKEGLDIYLFLFILNVHILLFVI